MRAVLAALAVLLCLGGAAVFTLFVLDSRRLHGAALQGREAGGRYFVAEHGREAEVSREDWERSRALGIAVFCTFPLALAGMGYLLFAEAFPRVILVGGRERAADAERRVRASGGVLAEVRCGGRLGWVNFGGPMLRVCVYPGGLVVKPLWMPAFGIPRADIRAVRREKAFLQDRVVVEHGAGVVRSPIRFEGRLAPGFTVALEGLASGRG